MKHFKLLFVILILITPRLVYSVENNSSLLVGVSPFFDSVIPVMFTEVRSSEPSTVESTTWEGRGLLFEVLHRPSFLWSNSNKIGLKFNHSFGIINWNRQEITYTQQHWRSHWVNKGYSYMYLPSIRTDSNLIGDAIGGYFNVGMYFVENCPRNVQSFEKANNTFTCGYSLGCGMYVKPYPGCPVIFDLDAYIWNKYFNNAKFKELDIIKISIYYEIY